MTREEDFIMTLNDLTKKWVDEKYMFRGGCAYASAILAREFKKMGIKYEVIIYDFHPCDVFKKKRSCAHMGIKVSLFGGECFIGGDFTMKWFIDNRFSNIGMVDPKDIMRYYKSVKRHDGWNEWYDVSCNATFSRLCNNIYKKFAVAECGK